jgi:hypothetical protein
MLTNNQFRYISYGIMIFIVLILISNIYITKINNNYTSSGLIEGFLNKNDKKKVDSGVSDLISKICDKKHKHEVIAYAKSFNNDIPKLKGVCTMNLMINMENKLNNPKDLFSNDTDIKDTIDTLNIIESNVKYLEQDCGGGMFSSGGSSLGFSFGDGDKGDGKKKGSSWFGSGGDKDKKDRSSKKSKGKDKALFGWATNNSSDSDSD